jgi:hypothetical protein
MADAPMNQQKTKKYNVTNLTPNQQRELFKDCISQPHFTAFIKNQQNQQTHYTFQSKTDIADQKEPKLSKLVQS